MTREDALRLMKLNSQVFEVYDVEIELPDASAYGGVARVQEIYEDKSGSIRYDYVCDLDFVGANESKRESGELLTDVDLDLVTVSKRVSRDDWRRIADELLTK